MKTILTLFVLFLSMEVLSQSTNPTNIYEKNLRASSLLYQDQKEIPDAQLLLLVPENQAEFDMFYGTTSPENPLAESDFFYSASRLIFEEAITQKNPKFYLPSLQLIRFADGEYAEEFIEYLESIIAMDSRKFCRVLRDTELIKQNPIRYYYELNQCE